MSAGLLFLSSRQLYDVSFDPEVGDESKVTLTLLKAKDKIQNINRNNY